jgi:aminopeptidase YwaD
MRKTIQPNNQRRARAGNGPEQVITKHVKACMEELCVTISGRETGSPGNVAATTYFAQSIAALGYHVECPEFDCIDWMHGAVVLEAGSVRFQAFPSPYSLGCSATARLVEASTLVELEKVDMTGNVLLMRAELAREQLMPKRFPFYNPDEHKRIVSVLEQRQPAAIVAATERNPSSVGALYPFPLFEDGDFDVPSVYMTSEEGSKLRQHLGKVVRLAFKASRIPSHGVNVVARKGKGGSRRVVFCAHIDARKGTPGALDNASGVATLLALAKLLKDYAGQTSIEIVALNGEDYYAVPGQIQYLASNAGRLDTIALAINVDDVGYKVGGTSFSFYACPDALASKARDILAAHGEFREGEAWPQGDHMMFAMNQVPAMAITADQSGSVSSHITHTARDTIDQVDCRKITRVALGLADLLRLPDSS